MNTYKNYIDLLRNILKNFDNNEFDSIIKKILSKIFDDYYMNRDNYVWCIDNLYKKFYVAKYNKLKKRYGSVKKDDLIFRFNRYNKEAYIIKLMKENLGLFLMKLKLMIVLLTQYYKRVILRIIKNISIMCL